MELPKNIGSHFAPVHDLLMWLQVRFLWHTHWRCGIETVNSVCPPSPSSQILSQLFKR